MRLSALRGLLMDDDPDFCFLTRRMAGKLGFKLQAVADADSAVAAFDASRASGEPFNLLLLDATIPGGRGAFEVLAELRELDPSVLAVWTSGWSPAQTEQDPRAGGFDLILNKPFDIDQLEEVAVAAAERIASRTVTSGSNQSDTGERGARRG